jgi:predicted RNA binding protein YcfA (HicA-like mRNA interferase family)
MSRLIPVSYRIVFKVLTKLGFTAQMPRTLRPSGLR